MTELRAAIDQVDAALVSLLAQRADYIDQAVVLKKRDGLPARIETRIEQVIEQVRTMALRDGFDADLAEDIWRRLIEWSIQREERGLSGQ